MFKEHMPEPEVLAMMSHSQEFEQVKVSVCTNGIKYKKTWNLEQDCDNQSIFCYLEFGLVKLFISSSFRHIPSIVPRTLYPRKVFFF